jgi:lipocalin
MVIVQNSGFYNGKTITANGYAYVRNVTAASNQLYVVFPTSLFGYPIFEQKGQYNVWSVDYDKFSMVYSCSQIIPVLLKSELVWILSRTTILDNLTMSILKGLLIVNGVDPSNLIYA